MITNPQADAEQAYILACKSVLPVGMVGLMLAAMFSATASMVSSQLNVFSGVLTNDIYRPLAKATNPKSLLKAGRFFTILLGALLVIIALEIEKWGQVKDLIISITELMVVPLLAPALWGIFSRKIGGRAVWITGLSGFGLGLLVRYGFGADGFLNHLETLNSWVITNSNTLKTLLGVIYPVAILTILELTSKGENPGWKNLQALEAQASDTADVASKKSNPIAAKVVAICLAICGVIMFALIFANESSHGILAAFGTILILISGTILYLTRNKHAATDATH